MLIDRILKKGVEHCGNFALSARLREALIRSEAVLCNNVAEYFYETNDREVWSLVDDFPNIAPPWSNTWFEWSPTEWINSDELGHIKNMAFGVVKKFGCLMQTVDLRSTRGKDWLGAVKSHAEHWFPSKNLDLKLGEDLRWLFSANTFREYSATGYISMWPCSTVGYITNEGIYRGQPDGSPIYVMHDNLENMVGRYARHSPDGKTIVDCSLEMVKESMSHSVVDFYIPAMTLCFIHCRNVELKTVNPGRRRGKSPKKHLVKYHVLDIQPVKALLKERGNIESTGLKQALHICRGNFATYTEEGKLFGRLTGTFWRPMHVRGSGKEGVVLKDYSADRLVTG